MIAVLDRTSVPVTAGVFSIVEVVFVRLAAGTDFDVTGAGFSNEDCAGLLVDLVVVCPGDFNGFTCTPDESAFRASDVDAESRNF